MTDHERFHFEKALLSLEKIVHSLESGQLELEDALKAFEEGIQLSRQCQKALDTAEQKVKLLANDELQSFHEAPPSCP
jgi:exodeoxyribonuclease VII small subunit